MNELTGTFIFDTTQQGNSLTQTWVSTEWNTGLSFNANGDYVEIATNPRLALDNEITLVLIARHSNPGNYDYMLSAGANNFGLYTGENGGIAFLLDQGDFGPTLIANYANTAHWNGKNHVFVGTYTSLTGTARLYLDGVEVANDDGNSVVIESSSRGPLALGNYGSADPNYGFGGAGEGVIELVLIYDYCFSPELVSTISREPYAMFYPMNYARLVNPNISDYYDSDGWVNFRVYQDTS